MPSVRFATLLLVLVAAAPARARAQDKEQLCRDIQNRPMRVGQWASYKWIGGRSDGGTMRFAIVGTEAQQGTMYYWYEMAITDPKRGAKGKTVIQMLVPGLGFQAGGVGGGGVRGLIMKNGDEPAARMPDQMVSMMGSRVASNITAEMTRSCREMDVVGWEQVTVPAGTFRALHFRHPREGTEAWVRPELYFAMVKVVMKDGSVMVLTGHGTGARSSITVGR
jgi:hypothetical protein